LFSPGIGLRVASLSSKLDNYFSSSGFLSHLSINHRRHGRGATFMKTKSMLQHPSLRAWSATLVGLITLAGILSSAEGALQLSDSFDYAIGSLAGNGPPPGSPPGQTVWTNLGGNAQVIAPGLDFIGDFSTGNKATTAGVAGANGDIVGVDVAPVVGGTKWVAFLIRKASGPAAPGGFAVIGLGQNNGIGMLFDENIYGIDTTVLPGPVMRARTNKAVSATTVLLVTKLDFTAGMEYIFVNPPSGSTPTNSQADASIAMGADFQANGFSNVALAEGFNTATFDFDELRIGDSFTEVVPEAGAATFANISTRLNVQTGGNVLIGGFIITGTDAKKVILRGLGPSLSNSMVQGVLADPVIELHKPDGTVVTNDNWKDTQKAEIMATTIPPPNDQESAIVETLDPGLYTVILSGKDGGTGVGLVEAYDLDSAAASQLANISTRGFVATDDGVMIGGFIIVGGTDAKPRTVVLRGVGPSLTGVTGQLQDPSLELHDANGALLSSNDDWMNGPDMELVSEVGLAPLSTKESALVATLAPGNYTAILRGVNNTTGIGLVEAYNIQ
jgi:hypothetical protein